MLPEVSQTILHTVFSVTCAIWSQQGNDNIENNFVFCNVVCSIKDNITQVISCRMLSRVSWAAFSKVLTLAMFFQEYYDNVEKRFYCAMLSKASRTTLPRVFSGQCFNNVACNNLKCCLDLSERKLHKEIICAI